jgi:hypothetical protein
MTDDYSSGNVPAGVRRKPADVLTGIGNCTGLAGSVEKISRDMRKSRMKTVKF